jgi:hypothetical protein
MESNKNTSVRKIRERAALLATCIAAIAGLNSHVASATVISFPDGAQQTLWAEHQNGQDPWTYTYATQTWSFTTQITGNFLSLGSSPLIGDLGGGAYTVNAQVDHSGNVLGGAFSWTSSSATLGVMSPEVFLSGTILGSQASGAGVMRLWASVDYTNPALSAWTTAPNFAALSFIGGPCWLPCEQPSGGFNVFGQDWSGSVIQPDIFGYKVDEPAPITMLLLTLGTLGISLLRQRRRA